MRTIVFNGRVHPERSNITFSIQQKGKPLKLQVAFPSIPTFELAVTIQRSQIIAVCFLPEFQDEWVWTLRNAIDDVVRNQIDLFGFLEGCAYQIEITGWVDAEDGHGFALGFIDSNIKKNSHFQDLPKLISENLTEANGLISIALQDSALRSALSDCRRALMYANGTSMYCYRAIEALRLGLSPDLPNNDNGRRMQWLELRRRLRFERSFIQEIEDFADDVRHANEIALTSEQRSQLMSRTWRIVERYMVFRLFGSLDELPEEKYPMLT